MNKGLYDFLKGIAIGKTPVSKSMASALANEILRDEIKKYWDFEFESSYTLERCKNLIKADVCDLIVECRLESKKMDFIKEYFSEIHLILAMLQDMANEYINAHEVENNE